MKARFIAVIAALCAVCVVAEAAEAPTEAVGANCPTGTQCARPMKPADVKMTCPYCRTCPPCQNSCGAKNAPAKCQAKNAQAPNDADDAGGVIEILEVQTVQTED